MRLYGLGMMREPRGNSPIFRRCGVTSMSVRERIAASASGCRASVTPAASAAHARVWSSGVAPMPPKLKTMSSDASVRRRVAVMSPGLSPRYWHQSSLIPRARRISISVAKCLSSRLPRTISSPMMIAPIPISHPRRRALDRLAAQLAEALEAVVDESEPAVHRHEEPEHGDMADERERDAQQKQLAPMAADDLGDLGGGAVLGEGIVAKHALVEIAEQNDGQHRPQQRDQPQRQADREEQRKQYQRSEGIPEAARDRPAPPPGEPRVIAPADVGDHRRHGNDADDQHRGDQNHGHEHEQQENPAEPCRDEIEGPDGDRPFVRRPPVQLGGDPLRGLAPVKHGERRPNDKRDDHRPYHEPEHLRMQQADKPSNQRSGHSLHLRILWTFAR